MINYILWASFKIRLSSVCLRWNTGQYIDTSAVYNLHPSAARSVLLTFGHRASCILGQAFHYSPENAFYIFNQQICFIIW